MKKYNIYLSTDSGKVREVNEDSFVINLNTKDINKSTQNLRGGALEEPLLCGVFDGMGGEKGGFDASDTAALVAAEYYKFLAKAQTSPEGSIKDYVKNCNRLIKKQLEENKQNRGGTTFALAYIFNDTVYLFSMGDSRIYLYRSGTLRRITRDHTLAQKKYEANIFTLEEAEQSNESHVLTRYLGMDPDSADYKAESYRQLTLNPGDKLLICSDGLYDMCSDKQIAKILSAKKAPYSINLVKAALKNGGIDNITCLVIEPVMEK